MIPDHPAHAANTIQYGGTHYKQFMVQPWDVVADWDLGYLDGTALKYIARWKYKNGTEDIKKAIHFLQKLLEVETGRMDQQGQLLRGSDGKESYCAGFDETIHRRFSGESYL